MSGLSGSPLGVGISFRVIGGFACLAVWLCTLPGAIAAPAVSGGTRTSQPAAAQGDQLRLAQRRVNARQEFATCNRNGIPSDRAIAACTRAIESRELKISEQATAYNSRGYELSRKGMLEAAMQDYGEALRLVPDHPHALINRAFGYMRLGEIEKGVQDVTLALEKDKGSPFLLSLMARLLARGGYPDEALKLAEQAVRAIPDTPVGYIARADALRAAGRNKEAIRDYLKAQSFRGNEENDVRDIETAMQEIAEGKPLGPQRTARHVALSDDPEWKACTTPGEKQIEACTRAADKYKEFPEVRSEILAMRGTGLAERKRHDEALKDLNEAIALHKTNAVAYAMRGSVYFDEKRFVEAEADLRQALLLKPHEELRKWIEKILPGVSYMAKLIAASEDCGREEKEAQMRCDRAISSGDYKNEELAMIVTQRGTIKQKRGDNEGAAADYRRALSLGPTSGIKAVIDQNMAAMKPVDKDVAACNIGQGKAALPLCTSAIDSGRYKGDELAQLLNVRGYLRASAGDREGSIADYRRLLTLNPSPSLRQQAETNLRNMARTGDLGDCERMTGKAAIAACDRAIASGKFSGGELGFAYARRGEHKHQAKDIAGAKADYAEALKTDLSPLARKAVENNLAIIEAANDKDYAGCIDQGDRIGAEIIADCDRAIASKKYSGQTLGNLLSSRARARVGRNEWTEAKADLETALKLDIPPASRKLAEQNLGIVEDLLLRNDKLYQGCFGQTSDHMSKTTQAVIADCDRAIASGNYDGDRLTELFVARAGAKAARDDIAGAAADYDGALARKPSMVVVRSIAMKRGSVSAIKDRIACLTPGLPEAAALPACDRAVAATIYEEAGRIPMLIARGVRKEKNGDLAGARADFARAHAARPALDDRRFLEARLKVLPAPKPEPQLSDCWTLKGDEALAVCTRFLANGKLSDPERGRVLLSSARIRIEKKDLIGAEDDLQKGRRLRLSEEMQSQFIAVTNTIAKMRGADLRPCMDKQGDEALAACERGIASGWFKAAELAELIAGRGHEKMRRGDRDGAHADYVRALEAGPNSTLKAELERNVPILAKPPADDDCRTLAGSAALVVCDRVIGTGKLTGNALARVLHDRARARIRKKDIAGAKADTEQALGLNPDEAVRTGLRETRVAVFSAEDGDFKTCATESGPDSFKACTNAIESGRFVEGEVEYLYRRRADKNEAGSRLADAKADYQRALELKPSKQTVADIERALKRIDERAKRNLETCLTKAGSEAYQSCRFAIISKLHSGGVLAELQKKSDEAAAAMRQEQAEKARKVNKAQQGK